MDKEFGYDDAIIIQNGQKRMFLQKQLSRAQELIAQIFKDVETIAKYDEQMAAIKKYDEQMAAIKKDEALYAKYVKAGKYESLKVNEDEPDVFFDTEYFKSTISSKITDVKEILYELAEEFMGLGMDEVEKSVTEELEEQEDSRQGEGFKNVLLGLVDKNKEGMTRFIEEELAPSVLKAKRFIFEDSVAMQMNIAVLVGTLKQYDDAFGAPKNSFDTMQSEVKEGIQLTDTCCKNYHM